MKSIKRIFFLLSFISVSYLSTFAQENQSYFLHTIEKDQSLYSISSMYGVSKADIIRLNPGCEDKIYAGQAIKIPQNKTAQKGETFHTIQPGETLYRLTTTYKVSAKAICDANPGLSAENFRIGQVIRIPSAAEAIDSTVEAVVAAPSEPAMQPAVKPRCKDMHKVKRRETIFSVSREYGISEQELIAANPELKNGNFSVSPTRLKNRQSLSPKQMPTSYRQVTANCSVKTKKFLRAFLLSKRPSCYHLTTNGW